MAKPIFPDSELLAYMEMRFAESNRFLSTEYMAYYMQFRLWQAPEDTAYAVLLNQSRYFVRSIQLTEGMLHKANLLSASILARLEDVSYFYVGHTHAEHSISPSPEDLNTNRILSERFPERPKYLGQIIVNNKMEYTYLQP